MNYIIDFETIGLDAKPHIFIGKRMFKPSIQFNPFKIRFWKIVDINKEC